MTPPSNGASAPAQASHMRTLLKFSIKAVHTTPQAHFRLAIGRDTSETATLVMGAAERLMQVNKEISLVFCFWST